ncbi:hypothetical protein V8F33_001531 [Rhypophila sp. PSN 637]
MMDAPVHGAFQPPDVDRAGLRPPPGFEHLAPVPGERDPSSSAGLFVNPGEPRFVSENQKIVDSRDRQVPSLLPYESEIPPLRISKLPQGQSSTALDTQSQISESDLVGLPRSRQLPRNPIKSPATMSSNEFYFPTPSLGSDTPFPDPGSDDDGDEMQVDEADPYPGSDLPSPNPGSDDDGDEMQVDEAVPSPGSERPSPDPGSNDNRHETQVEGSEHPSLALSRVPTPKTHAPMFQHHRAQLVGIMCQKAEYIEVQEELENSSIFHLDWSAGNSKDLCTVTLDEPKTGSEAQSTEEVPISPAPGDDRWSMAMFFGDYITDMMGLNIMFIEIQVKRVLSADSDLIKRCRIGSLHVADYLDPKPNDPASSTAQDDGERPVSPEPLLSAPMGSDQQASDPSSGKRARDATSTEPDNPPVDTSTEPDSANPPVDKAEPSLVNSADDGEPSSTRRKLPNWKEKSFIYCVRVVALALPEKLPRINRFAGPMSADRRATLLGSGGWIVPPLEDRMKWHNDNKDPRERTGQSASDKAIKKTQLCLARPVQFDWSGNTPPCSHGEPCPVWRELAEPCLEDVYWMVWQLLAGKQYAGFTGGDTFSREPTSNPITDLLNHCPFQSPSREALRTSALL